MRQRFHLGQLPSYLLLSARGALLVSLGLYALSVALPWTGLALRGRGPGDLPELVRVQLTCGAILVLLYGLAWYRQHFLLERGERLTLEALATGQWRWLGPGIARMALISRDETDSRLDLLRVAPDVPLPAHGHADFETTVVLQGAFEDNDFNYAIGDFIEADAETDHAPRALKEESCICLIATTGRLHPRNWLLRLLQPLSRM